MVLEGAQTTGLKPCQILLRSGGFPTLSRLRRTILLGSSMLLLALSASLGVVAAQPLPPALVLEVNPISQAAGNITLHGVAVDCGSGQAATRVSVYDGADPSASYVADVAFDTSMDLSDSCVGTPGAALIGFTLIFDSRMMDDGPRSLLFVAQYPDGRSSSVSAEVTLENVPPYESQE